MVTGRVVVTRVGGRYDGLRSEVGLSWSAEDPYAVSMVFSPASGPVHWVVSRELLAAGLEGPAGLGDVAVLPALHDDSRVELILESPTGRAVFLVARRALAEFLTEVGRQASVGVGPVLEAWLAGVRS